MTITYEYLLRTWSQMKEQVKTTPITRHLPTEEPKIRLRLFCTEQRMVGLLINAKQGDSIRSKSSFSNLTLVNRKNNDNSNDIVIILNSPEYETCFALLCMQIIRGLPRVTGKISSYLNTVLSEWNSFLKGNKQLSLETERGLWCELHILGLAIKAYGSEVAFNSWFGPDNAPQDFIFEAGAVEVKSVFEKAAEVKITSLDQLDFAGQLYLAIVNLAPDPLGKTLEEKVKLIEGLLEDVNLKSFFYESLYRVGYVPSLDRTGSDSAYKAEDINWFNASDDEFPKLIRTKVNPAIHSARYSLNISALERFKTEALL